MGGEGTQPIVSAVRGPSDSLVQSIPYIFAGLAVALGFRAGLFNIGAEGQIGIGWMVAIIVGFSFHGLPAIIHLPLAILLGAVAGGLWAAIAGVLKARTGAHEVITTIMLNYVSFRLSEWLLCGPLEFTQGTCRTQDIAASAFLPRFLDHPATIHWGFILALLAAAATGWFLFRTTWGFELRTVGANPNAARYGGMSVAKNYVLAMFLSGGLAGLAGVSQGLGVTHNIALGFSAGYGFDSIALALLGKSQPGRGAWGQHLVWRVAGRGGPDAVGSRRSDGNRADHSILGDHLYRRAGHYPRTFTACARRAAKIPKSRSFPVAGEHKGGHDDSSSADTNRSPGYRHRPPRSPHQRADGAGRSDHCHSGRIRHPTGRPIGIHRPDLGHALFAAVAKHPVRGGGDVLLFRRPAALPRVSIRFKRRSVGRPSF